MRALRSYTSYGKKAWSKIINLVMAGTFLLNVVLPEYAFGNPIPVEEKSQSMPVGYGNKAIYEANNLQKDVTQNMPTPRRQGDLDKNGIIDTQDFSLWFKSNGSRQEEKNFPKTYDLNYDGAIDIADYILMTEGFYVQEGLIGRLVGDLNGDGEFDMSDAIEWRRRNGGERGDSKYTVFGDLNFDNIINDIDKAILKKVLGHRGYNGETVTLSSDGSYTQWSPVYSLNVNIDPFEDRGDLLAEDGKTVIGLYKFYGFEDYEKNPRWILKVQHKVKGHYWQWGDGHIFLTRKDGEGLVYMGSSTWIIDNDIDTTQPHIIPLTKFFDDPLSLSSSEYRTLSNFIYNNSGRILLGADFKNTFIPAYLNRLLDALSMSPNFDFKDQAEPVGMLLKLQYEPYVGSGQKQAIVQRLSEVWDKLSLRMKGDFLCYLAVGNGKTMNMLGGLAVRYMDEIVKAYPSLSQVYLRSYGFSKAITAAKDIIKNLDLDPLLRKEIIRRIFDQFKSEAQYFGRNWNSPSTFSFIYDAVVKNDGIVLNAKDYEKEIKDFINRAVSANTSMASFLIIFNDLPQYVNSSLYGALEVHIDKAIAQYDAGYYKAILLLSALNWPISKEKKTKIENLVTSRGFGQWAKESYDLFIFFDIYGLKPLGLSCAGQDRFFKEITDTLMLRFNERGNFDNWTGVFDNTLYKFIHYLKQSPSFERYAKYLLPLLRKFNPKQTGESDKQYSERMARIEVLWLKDRIFLYDLSGGTYKERGYIDSISDFSKNHPDWLDVVVLATVEGGESKAGVSQFNWKVRYTTPYLLGESLLHEGGHALELRHEYGTRDLDTLVSYWYQEYKEVSSLNYVSSYSRINTREYFAEFTRYFHMDSTSWLKTAIDRYKSGHPALLNMFTFIWNMHTPKDGVPAGTRPLYRLNQKGILDREYTEAEWLEGNFKEGTFRFKLGQNIYTVEYSNYKIMGITESVGTAYYNKDGTVKEVKYERYYYDKDGNRKYVGTSKLVYSYYKGRQRRTEEKIYYYDEKKQLSRVESVIKSYLTNGRLSYTQHQNDYYSPNGIKTKSTTMTRYYDSRGNPSSSTVNTIIYNTQSDAQKKSKVQTIENFNKNGNRTSTSTTTTIYNQNMSLSEVTRENARYDTTGNLREPVSIQRKIYEYDSQKRKTLFVAEIKTGFSNLTNKVEIGLYDYKLLTKTLIEIASNDPYRFVANLSLGDAKNYSSEKKIVFFYRRSFYEKYIFYTLFYY